MIDKLIHFVLRNKFLIMAAVFILIAFGIYAFEKLPIDAFPDVTSIQVQVISKSPGMSPVEVEQLVTFPLEVEFMGLPKKTELRSVTKLGLSVITVVFEDGTDIYWARQIVLERLIQAREKLPKGIETILGPIATGLGEVYQYTLERSQKPEARSQKPVCSLIAPYSRLQTSYPQVRLRRHLGNPGRLHYLPAEIQIFCRRLRYRRYHPLSACRRLFFLQ